MTQPPERVQRFYTVGQVAELLGIATGTVTQWCRHGLLDGAYSFARRWFIPQESLTSFERPKLLGRRPKAS